MTALRFPVTAWLGPVAVPVGMACGLLATTAPLAAEPVPLEVPFEPLEVDVGEVCEPRPPLPAVVARWTDWDGRTMPDDRTEMVRRDLRILREADARAWFGTIEAGMARLREIDEGYLERDWLSDRIELALAAGRPEILTEEDLVPRLLEAGLDGAPGAQHFASRLLREGTGIETDEARGRELLIAAAYGGQSEALLELAAATSDGTAVEGWNIDPALAVTLAFGGLVGDVDPLICDRLNRIGSAYRLGEVVAQDIPLAERWYRLAANLGDFNAAWQVAQLHMRAEGVAKDNDVLLAHLGQAAAGGLPFAQAELGRVYEVGALVERDLARARELYEAAAAAGHYEGLLRLESLLSDLDAPTEADRQRRREVLERLVAMAEPPAWALVELGDLVLESEGRWAGEAEALALFQRAIEVSPDDIAATMRLTALGYRGAETYEELLALTSTLQETVLANGSASSMDELIEAYTCRSPVGPHRGHADYWRRMRVAAGNVSVVPPREGATEEEMALLLTRAQSQALAGRASSLAVLLERRDDLGLPLDEGRLRALSAQGETGPLTEMARLALDRASTPAQTREALDTLRAAVAAGEAGAREELLAALMADGLEPSEEAEVGPLAEALAAEGHGLALAALAALGGETAAAREAVWTAHRATIEADGDFDAILFAMPFLGDERQRDDALDRARAVMPCNTLAALRMADTLHGLGRQDEVERWLEVALAAGAEQGWLVVAVSDAYRELSARPDAAEVAMTLLQQERAAGNRTAVLRLASLAQEGRIDLPAEETASLFVDLIGASDIRDVPSVLRRVRRATTEVQTLVEAEVDIRALFEEAAGAGSAVGQLELAKIVRAEAQGQGDLARYAALLTAAAEQGEPEAMQLLSEAYSLGLGVEPSVETSRDWLFRAAEAGNEEAAATVRLLETQGITQ